jgi:hypothetical protein
MLPLKFGATALEDIAMLDFLCRELLVSFIGDATVRGEGKLLSSISISIIPLVVWTASPIYVL